MKSWFECLTTRFSQSALADFSLSPFLSLFFTISFHFHVYALSTAKLSVSQLVGWVCFVIEESQSKKRHF